MSLQLTTERLTITIGERHLIADLNITIEAGQCWAILGLNGTGKTTLLHKLAGITNIGTGQVYLNQQSLDSVTPKRISQQIGVLLQDSDNSFPATVLDAVLIGRHPFLSTWQWETEQDRDMARLVLQHVGLQGFENRNITTLSGGERRRVGIACLLLQDPDLFLLDEPVNHLDPQHQHSILSRFASLCREKSKACCMVLHDVNLAVRYCDHALLIHEDGTHESGTANEMLSTDRLSRLYQYPVACIREGNKRAFLTG